MQRKKPRSRYSSEPGLTRSGKKRVVTPASITPLEFGFLKSLAAHRFLSTDYLAALNGTSYGYGKVVVDALKGAPGCYIKVADEQLANGSLYLRTSRFLELASAGITELEERGILIPPRKSVRNFRHQVMADQIMASFHLGSHDDISIISRSEILSDPQTPKKTRESGSPESIPFGDKHIRPDGEMFVLKTPTGFNFFPGVEADTGTEPIHSYDADRSSIRAKFAAYLTIIADKTYEKHFGASTFNIPFVTATHRRLDSMMALLHDMTKEKPSLRKHFLFKTHPLFTSSTKPRPTGHMIDEEWLRVGYPPLAFRTIKPEVQSKEELSHGGGSGKQRTK